MGSAAFYETQQVGVTSKAALKHALESRLSVICV